MSRIDASRRDASWPSSGNGGRPPRRRGRRFLKDLALSLAGIVALVAVVAVGLWIAVSSTAGSSWLFERIRSRLPLAIEASLTDGDLLGPMTLSDIRWLGEATPEGTLAVEIDRVELDWQPLALLEGRVLIDRILARAVRIEMPPNEEPIELIDVDLPLTLELPDLTLSGIELTSGGDLLTVLDEAHLAATASGRQVRIHQLSISGDGLDLQSSGRITTVGAYPLSLRLDWSAAGGEDLRIAGTGRLGGDLQRLEVEQVIESPVTVPISGTILELLDRPIFDLSAEIADLDPRSIDEAYPPIVLDGRIELQGTLGDYRLAGDVGLRSEAVPDGQWRFKGRGDLAAFELEALHLRLSKGELRAVGRLAWKPEVEWRLEVEADGADPALLLPDWPGRIDFRGRTSGRWTEAGFELVASVPQLAGELRGLPIHGGLELSGTPQRLDLASLELRSGDARIEAVGQLTLEPDLEWRFEVEGDAVDPSLVLPEWQGALDFRGRTSGRWPEAGPDFTASIPQLEGELRGHPVRGSLELTATPDRLELKTLDLRVGTVVLEAAGVLGDELDLTWSLDAEDVRSIHPDVRGRLVAAGELRGTRREPQITLEATGSDLAYGDLELASLAADVDLVWAEDAPIRLRFEAEGVKSGDLSLARLEVEADGRREAIQLTARADEVTSGELFADRLELEMNGATADHELTARASNEHGLLTLRARGGLTREPATELDAASWDGILLAADLELGDLGRWGLDRPAELHAGAKAARLATACWRQDVSEQACLELEWAAEAGWNAAGSLDQIPLGFFAPFLPQETLVEGTVDAEFTASADADGRLSAELTGDSLGTLTLQRGSTKGPARQFRARISEGRIDDDGAHFSGDFELPSSRLRLQLALPAYRSLDAPIASQELHGTIQGNMADISPLEPFLLGVRRLQGSIQADAEIGGSLADPAIQGEITLLAAMELPALGIALDRVEVRVVGDDSDVLRLSGEIVSGDGTLKLSGTTPMAPTQAQPAVLRLDGDNFRIADTPEARVWFSPRLQMTAHPGSVEVGGEIDLPRAQIELTDSVRTAVPISPDVVIVGGLDEPAAAGPRIVADLRLNFGEAIEVRGEGFSARVGGGLRIVEDGTRSPIAHGELKIRNGKYRGYGQELRIDDGRVLFAGGPIDNPSLNIPAYRRARDGVIAGITIRGTLEHPEASFYSIPQMTDPEILSYILTGRGRRPGEQSQTTDSAAASLGLAQSTAVLNQIGLKNVSLQTDGTLDEAEIVLGRYLAPGLYVSYGIGVFEQLNTVRLRYEISGGWILEVDSNSKGNGADILYSFEK